MWRSILVSISIVFAYIFGAYTAMDANTIKDYIKTDGLYKLSKDKMDDLVFTKQWSHINSDGRDFSFRAHTYLGDAKAGENLYSGTCDIDLIMKSWHESKKHNEVLNMPIERVILNIQRVDSMCYATYHVLSTE